MLYGFLKPIAIVFNKLWFNFNVSGKENIPQDGRMVIVSNHVRSYDPVAIAVHIKRPVTFLAKVELFQNKILAWFLKKLNAIPVNREKVAMSTFKQAMNVLKQDKILGLFPEGTRVKNREDSHPLEGFVMFALKTESPIIPAHIDGTYKFRSKTKLTFGSPIYLDEYYGKRLKGEEMARLSHQIMDEIYQL